METKILIAGFGGQGVIVVGNVLAYACVEAGKNLLAMVSYGGEMRGGTAKAIISISDDEIDSPIIDNPDHAIIMNAPSLVAYLDSLETGATVLINSSMIDRNLVDRFDVDIVPVDATNLAIKMGNIKVANIIMLGVLIQKTTMLQKEHILKGMKRAFYKAKRGLYYINEDAFELGLNLKLPASS
jgi:2-oxoglutarate ferredoxin oxidoreductase subunit gamma